MHWPRKPINYSSHQASSLDLLTSDSTSTIFVLHPPKPRFRRNSNSSSSCSTTSGRSRAPAVSHSNQRSPSRLLHLLVAQDAWRQGPEVKATLLLVGKLAGRQEETFFLPCSSSSSLLYLKDTFSSRKFLVDSGASVSVFLAPASSSSFGIRLVTANGFTLSCSKFRIIPLQFSSLSLNVIIGFSLPILILGAFGFCQGWVLHHGKDWNYWRFQLSQSRYFQWSTEMFLSKESVLSKWNCFLSVPKSSVNKTVSWILRDYNMLILIYKDNLAKRKK